MIEITGRKLIYSVFTPASEWVSELTPASSPIDTPKFSSGLSIKECEENNRGIAPNYLAVFCNKSNNVIKSEQDVYILSGKPTDKPCTNHSIIAGEHLRRCISLFSARKLTKCTWVNDKDEYLTPLVYRVRK